MKTKYLEAEPAYLTSRQRHINFDVEFSSAAWPSWGRNARLCLYFSPFYCLHCISYHCHWIIKTLCFLARITRKEQKEGFTGRDMWENVCLQAAWSVVLHLHAGAEAGSTGLLCSSSSVLTWHLFGAGGMMGNRMENSIICVTVCMGGGWNVP